jgi:hypothetical protein
MSSSGLWADDDDDETLSRYLLYLLIKEFSL